MDEPSQSVTFRLVFDGRLVAGRNAAQVEAEFERRFGAKTKNRVFCGKPVTLNRDLSREDAQKRQRQFEQLGIVVQMIPATTAAAELSLVDAPAESAERQEAPPAPPQGEPPKAEFGVLPDRPAPVRAKRVRGDVYSKAELADAFKDATELPPPSRDYLLKLVPVTVLMLLLPLIYLGITLSSGGATVWVAIEGFAWMTDKPGYLRLVGYAAAVLGMVLLTLFLLRPLVARLGTGPQPVRLDEAREPVLFDLVDRITDAVGAPMPDEILVDSEANASAHLTRGAFSKGLTLTLGMPLIYGLDLQSLTGVLAHEFGHFTQRVGMRASALVHQVNYWFYRQVHEQDSWDRFVDEWGESGNPVLTLAAVVAQLGSFLVRLLLHLLSMLAALFSLSLSRQMEYDADRYEIGLVGSSAYQKTAEAMRMLGVGHQLAVADLSIAFDSDKKIDNLPKFAAMRAARFTAKERQEIMASVAEVNTSVFDTHPSDQARIRKAVEANVDARFVHTGPAKKLLCEPERLAKLVTLQWYRSFGIDASPADLLPVDEFASESELLKNADEALQAYFGELDMRPQYLPLVTPSALAGLDDAQLLSSLDETREKLRADKVDFMLLRKRLDEDMEYQYYYRQALFWRRAGFEIDLNAYRLPLTTDVVAEITAKIGGYKSSENEARAALRPCVELQGRRLCLGLELAGRAGKTPASEIERLRRAYAAIAAAEADLEKLEEIGERVDLILQVLEALPDDAKYQRQLQSDISHIEQLQHRVRSSLGGVPDPFADEKPLTDILPGEYSGPGEREASATLGDAARFMRSLARTGSKILGRMAEIADSVERSH